MIPLTPNQHYVNAHPNGDTHDINKEYQYICLIAKTNVIYENIFKNNNLIYYDFEKFTRLPSRCVCCYTITPEDLVKSCRLALNKKTTIF